MCAIDDGFSDSVASYSAKQPTNQPANKPVSVSVIVCDARHKSQNEAAESEKAIEFSCVAKE